MGDRLGNLPLELSIEIFSYLSAEELFSARQINKRWRNIANSECLWKHLCDVKDISYYAPPKKYETLNYFCNSARKYFIYHKTLKNNWISAKSHILSELSAPTTESIKFWKRTFVRTYNNGHVIDIFKVDGECKVHRLQRIDTRFKLDGSDHVMINDSWLAISRLNTQLLYKFKPNINEYKLSWILILALQEGLTNCLYVNEDTSLDVIDNFLLTYQTNTWDVCCQCIFDEYIWIYLYPHNLVIKLSDDTKKAVILQRLQSGSEKICYDKMGVTAYLSMKIGLFTQDGSLKFTYPDNSAEIEHEDGMLLRLECVKQNGFTVAFLQKTSRDIVVLVNRETHDTLLLTDLIPLLIELHPTKPLIFVISYYYPCPTDSRRTIRCYSSITGEIYWNTELTFLPDCISAQVINDRFLLLTCPKIGIHKNILYNCSTGKFVSILEETHHPVTISDVFTVYKMFARSITLAVKCYL